MYIAFKHIFRRCSRHQGSFLCFCCLSSEFHFNRRNVPVLYCFCVAPWHGKAMAKLYLPQNRGCECDLEGRLFTSIMLVKLLHLKVWLLISIKRFVTSQAGHLVNCPVRDNSNAYKEWSCPLLYMRSHNPPVIIVGFCYGSLAILKGLSTFVFLLFFPFESTNFEAAWLDWQMTI